MSPALNGSSVIRRFKCSNVIEIYNGITFDFYTGLPHINTRAMMLQTRHWVTQYQALSATVGWPGDGAIILLTTYTQCVCVHMTISTSAKYIFIVNIACQSLYSPYLDMYLSMSAHISVKFKPQTINCTYYLHSLVPCLRAPGEKRSGERSQISWLITQME